MLGLTPPPWKDPPLSKIGFRRKPGKSLGSIPKLVRVSLRACVGVLPCGWSCVSLLGRPWASRLAPRKGCVAKLPMSIGTGSPGDHSWEAVKALGLDKYFNILVSKNDVKKGKPDPETFLKCAEAMNVDPRFCQVFEDGDPGLEAARTAGMMATDIREFVGR